MKRNELNEWRNEGMNEGMNEWMNELLSKWMNQKCFPPKKVLFFDHLLFGIIIIPFNINQVIKLKSIALQGLQST